MVLSRVTMRCCRQGSRSWEHPTAVAVKEFFGLAVAFYEVFGTRSAWRRPEEWWQVLAAHGLACRAKIMGSCLERRRRLHATGTP